ncbi:MAG: hypothetical protein IPJ19_15410 [Planctomycetes bacterium]|nr:hypothetical protein [Planctomycetota bacterium]
MATDLRLPPLPVPRTAQATNVVSSWMRAGAAPEGAEAHEKPERWYRVLWLTGVDYFSTLGYQPGIALLAAGVLSPIATAVLVAVTLLGAVPVYSQVAARSFAGQGSIAMLESLLHGWKGKVFVLVLLGFAATDFVITMTLSAADAAQHAVENPVLKPYLEGHSFAATVGLLALLAGVFLKGFREAIRLAIAIAIPYILINLVVLGFGMVEILGRPELFRNWTGSLEMHGDWAALLLASSILFPKLALGMSGFETGVAVMPHVEGTQEDATTPTPKGRIRATRKLLLTAALIMSVMLLLSSFVTTLLIPAEAYAADGPAAGRAIAYLAHELLGNFWGSAYDVCTIAVLWFAGASAMAGLLNLIPRYLPRFGMAPLWTAYRRPLVLILFGISLLITWIFDASVEAQGSAYATGVLVLMLSAALAVALAHWGDFRSRAGLVARAADLAKCGYFWVITGVFAFTLVDNVIGRPMGAIIGGCFVLAILVLGGLSRIQRATELRVSEIQLADEGTAELWRGIVGRKVHLVPLRGTTEVERKEKAASLREHYKIEGPLAFLHVNLMDNRSEFLAPLTLHMARMNGDFVITVHGANAVANTIAYLSELLDPVSLFIGLTGDNLMSQAVRYLLWGEGEVGLMVYKILLRYWDWTVEKDDVRPRIFLMSEGSEPSFSWGQSNWGKGL